jgi:hypothetical protein
LLALLPQLGRVLTKKGTAMHPALTPVNLTGPIALISAALWCAATVTAIIVPDRKTTAPPATAASALPAPDHLLALAPTEDVLPKADRLPFAARFAAAPPVSLLPKPTPVDRTGQNSVLVAPGDRQPTTDRPRRHAHARDVCERHGMHKVRTHRGRSWRCRR